MSGVSEDLIFSDFSGDLGSTVNATFEDENPTRKSSNSGKRQEQSDVDVLESTSASDVLDSTNASDVSDSTDSNDVSDSTDESEDNANQPQVTVEKNVKKQMKSHVDVLESSDETDVSDSTVESEEGANQPQVTVQEKDESLVFHRHRKIAIIDSDSSESEHESESEAEEEEELLPTFANTTVSRLSENFGALKQDLCSTKMGDDLETIVELSGASEISNDIIDLSSDEEAIAPRGPFIKPVATVKKEFPIKAEPNTMRNYVKIETPEDVKPKIEENVVSRATYEDQQRIIGQFKADLAKLSSIYRTANLAGLPDKGKLLRMRQESIEASLKMASLKLSTMVVGAESPALKERRPIAWEDIKVQSDVVQPKTLGQKALQTYTTQKSVTMERLEQLHGSLASCPTEETLAEDPIGLKVTLMQHQKHALAWLMWRERQEPAGGILADDMGLGKTLTMISLMLKTKELMPDRPGKENVNRKDHLFEGGTLIVCPASVLKQWESEVGKRCRRGLASVELFHGSKRESKARYLAKYDMVLTTYTICSIENEKGSSPLYGVRWRRIILDEGHQIRNYKSQSCIAACNLEGQSRWVLTGTPIHNKEMDMYSLLKFLRCTPFDDYSIWKKWIANKDTGGYQRLQTVIASLMLRRTKKQLQEKGQLASLPERTWKIVEIKLEKDEMDVYEKVMFYSKTLFAQYLHQRANKGSYEELTSRPAMTKGVDPNSQYIKIYEKLAQKNRVKEVKQHEILMILLRLRQACCHPTLITQFLEREEFEEDNEMAEINLMEELEKLNLEDQVETMEDGGEENGAAVAKKVLNMENPVFSSEHRSSKIASILEMIKDIVWNKKEKAIIVSQWTSFLRLIGNHLAQDNIAFSQLDGTLNVQKRMIMVDDFNNKSHPTKVLLLSLTAGGVGLNLVGANHLLLIDIHWNPQLELQAQDRIYRVGQEKPVFIYKFVTVGTIEQRVKQLQDYKLSIADSMLTGAKPQQTQLSLQDLRTLFNM